MGNPNEYGTREPAPPFLSGITWRAITPDDLPALVELAGACFLADGGIGWMFKLESLSERFFPDAPRAATGAFAPEGRLVACAAVHTQEDANRTRAVITRAVIIGHVHPGLRNQGIGTYLMHWSQVQARSLLVGVPANQQVVQQVATESLTEPASRLYRAFGFEVVFNELVMARDLLLPLPDRALPPGVTLANWQPDLAEQFFQAYDSAFRERPGFPGWSAGEWISRVTENDHKPEWSLLAKAGGLPLGFVIGTIDLTTDPPGGYVWQIGVVPSQRRRGLASLLLVETMQRMQAGGAASAMLTVHVNNPGAIQAYSQLGFVTVGRRARYERVVEG
jgi:mycothiol synthase